MGIIRRTLRSTFGAGFSAVVCLGSFGLPFLMAQWQPVPQLVTVAESPARAVFLDLSPPPAPPAAGEIEAILAQEPELEAPARPELSSDDPGLDEVSEEEALAAAPLEEQLTLPPEASERQPATRRVIDRDARRAHLLAMKRAELQGKRQAAREAEAAREAAEAAEKAAKRQARCDAQKLPIEAVGGDRYTVEDDVVRTYIADLDQAQRLAWVGWARDDGGEIRGFKVKKIKSCSPLHQAGIRNGDVITSVNGKPITNVTQAWAAWNKLKRKRDIQVELERKGEPRTMRYQVV